MTLEGILEGYTNHFVRLPANPRTNFRVGLIKTEEILLLLSLQIFDYPSPGGRVIIRAMTCLSCFRSAENFSLPRIIESHSHKREIEMHTNLQN